jgi:hypothetical protein
MRGVKFFSDATNLIIAFVWQATYRFIRLWRSGPGVRSDMFSGPEYYVCHREGHGARSERSRTCKCVFLRTYLGCFLKKIVVGVKSSRWRSVFVSIVRQSSFVFVGEKWRMFCRANYIVLPVTSEREREVNFKPEVKPWSETHHQTLFYYTAKYCCMNACVPYYLRISGKYKLRIWWHFILSI